jgi:hypothetical protein
LADAYHRLGATDMALVPISYIPLPISYIPLPISYMPLPISAYHRLGATDMALVSSDNEHGLVQR